MPSSTPITTSRNIVNPGNFKELHDRNHSGLCPRVSVDELDETFPGSQVRNFVCLLPMSGIRISPTFVPQHAKEAMIFRVGQSLQTGVLALWMVKPQLDGVLSHAIPHGRVDVMFGQVITTEAHFAFEGGRVHSNHTAEMSAVVEALSFLGPHGPVARDAHSCVFNDSKHAGVCLGTNLARTHVQLGLSCHSYC